MLRCPKCNRTYQDDMQKFCTHDGGRLVPDIEQPKNFDPNATVHADLSNLDIPVTPVSRPPAQDMNATLAGPPPAAAPPVAPPAAAPPSPPPSSPAPSTGGFRSSDTAPTNFPQTTKLGEPPPRMDYPAPAAAPPPRAPEPPPSEPVQQPTPPAQFPTMMAPPPQSPPATSAPVSSADLPGVSTPLPHSSAALPPAGSGQFPTQSSALPAAPTTGPIHVAPPKKKSKVGMILAVAGALVLLLLVAGGVGAYFYLNRAKPAPETPAVSVNPTLDSNSNNANNNTATEPKLTTKPKVVEAPPNSVKFENSASNLDGKLAEHYVDFYFYYPQSWQKNAKAGVPGAANFVEVERKLPPDFTQENLTVSWYESKGTVEADLAGKLPALIKEWDANFAKTLPEYQKVSEGKTTINGIDGYELRFKALSRGTEKGDLNIWGRVVFLPPGDEESTKGVTLLMLTTSLAPELQGVDDVGSKGELAMLLNTFTLGKSS